MACKVFGQKILFQVVVFLLFVGILCRTEAVKKKEKKTAKIGKDITDYTDADVHRLLDQWDVSSYLEQEIAFIISVRAVLQFSVTAKVVTSLPYTVCPTNG